MSYRISVFLFFIFLIAVETACKKDSFLKSGGELAYSTDTLRFDTVFTSVGSATRAVKIYNRNNSKIKIQTIRLAGGTASPFRMNIDGQATKEIENVEVAAHDSLYVFVAVTVNPGSGNLPFLVTDAIEAVLNNQTFTLPLEAYGQDAHYIVDSVLGSQTWINDKPYVIVHSALVDSLCILTIQKGCRIYMHQDSKLYVKGTLNVYGTKQDSVIFQGDRLDRDYFGYKDYPGEWQGIQFLGPSTKSHINYAIIKNAGLADAAIYVQPPDFFDINNPTLELKNTVIENALGYGILGFNAHIYAENCLIHTCGSSNIALVEGGTYMFDYCTIGNYGGMGIDHTQDPTLLVLNYRDTSLTGYKGNNLTASFTNCVVYGSLDDEAYFGKKTEWTYTVTLDHCLLKRMTALSNVTANTCLFNQDPLFTDYSKWDYHPQTGSAVKGNGLSLSSIVNDLDGNPRGNPPSIGCYE